MSSFHWLTKIEDLDFKFDKNTTLAFQDLQNPTPDRTQPLEISA